MQTQSSIFIWCQEFKNPGEEETDTKQISKSKQS